MTADAYAGMSAEAVQSGFDPTSTGEALREAVFYTAESAYVFSVSRHGVRAVWKRQ